jgi:uncharacterized protein (TIGR03437 family)
MLALATAASAQQPQIAAGGIRGAALSTPATQFLSPGALFTIFGSGFAAAPAHIAQPAARSLPTVLGHACVMIGGVGASLLDVAPGRIDGQVPTSLSPGNFAVQVVANCDSSSPAASAPVSLEIRGVSPELFHLKSSASGISPIVAYKAGSGILTGSGDPALPYHSAPAKPGETLILYASGLGPVSPLASEVAVSIGNVHLPPANILSAGIVPGYAGLYQVEIAIPQGVRSGPQPMVVSVGGVSSPASVYLSMDSGCDLPSIDSFVASPGSQGGAYTVYWSVTNADSVSFGSPLDSLGSQSASGSLQYTFTAGTTLTLTAVNSCGSASANAAVSVGAPVVSQLMDLQGAPTAMATAGDTLQIAVQNPGGPSAALDAVFTTPDGLAYQFPISSDSSGNLYFTVPVLIGASYDTPLTAQVSVSVNGVFSTTSQPLTISLPVYSGDAVADFSTYLDGLGSGFQDAATQYSQASGDSTNAAAQLNIVGDYLGILQAAVSQVKATGSAQLPLYPAIDGVATPPASTLTPQEIGLLMGAMQRAQDIVFSSSSALPATLARRSNEAALRLRPLDDSSPDCQGRTLADKVPLIAVCQFTQTVNAPLMNSGKALSSLNLIALSANPALGVATLGTGAAAGSAAGTLGMMSGASNLLCLSAPIWFDRLGISPDTIPNVGPNPGSDVKSKVVAINAFMSPRVTTGDVASQVIRVAGRGMFQDASNALVPIAQNSAVRAAQVAALSKGSKLLGSSLAAEIGKDGVAPNLTGGSPVQVGFCGNDLLSVNWPPTIIEPDPNPPATQGNNDFYWYGIQKAKNTPIEVLVNVQHVLVYDNSTGCGAPNGSVSLTCKPAISVGPSKKVALYEGSTQAAYGCSADSRSTQYFQPADYPITYKNHFRQTAQAASNSARLDVTQVLGTSWTFSVGLSISTAYTSDCKPGLEGAMGADNAGAGMFLYIVQEPTDGEDPDPNQSVTITVDGTACPNNANGDVVLTTIDGARINTLDASGHASWTIDGQSANGKSNLVLIVNSGGGPSCTVSGTIQVTDSSSTN